MSSAMPRRKAHGRRTASHPPKQTSQHQLFSSEQMHENSKDQQPQRRKNDFPYLTLLAILVAIACWILAGVVLYKSHGELIDTWYPQPSVYLSILSVLAAACLHISYHHGSSIAWWVNVEQLDIENLDEFELHNQSNNDSDGADDTQEDHSRRKKKLQKQLIQGSKLWSSTHSATTAISTLWSDKRITLIPLASIIIALLPAATPLLQRSSYVGNITMSIDFPYGIPINEYMPKDFTGILDNNGNPSDISPAFLAITNQYGSSDFIELDNSTGCFSGSCTASLPGFGLLPKCDNATTSNSVFNGSANESLQGVFSVTYAYHGSHNSTTYLMTQTATWKENGALLPNTNECSSVIRTRTYTFSSAVIGYNATFYDDLVSLTPNTSYKDDSTIEGNTHDPPDWWSGVYFFLSQNFDSTASLGYSNGDYNVSIQGDLPTSYQDNPSASACDRTWSDPTDDLLALLRQIVFNTALVSAIQNNSLPIQQTSITYTDEFFVYQSDYRFLGVAVALFSASVIVVVLMASKWHLPEKPATASPVGLVELLHPGLKLRQGRHAIGTIYKLIDSDDDS